MSFKKENHLDEDQLIRAIVDETDLSPSVRDHLSSCPLCRAGMEQIEQDLTDLGKVAERLAPAKHREVSLPAWGPSRVNQWFLNWRLSFGAIAAAASSALTL